jgi:hypothetical protein
VIYRQRGPFLNLFLTLVLLVGGLAGGCGKQEAKVPQQDTAAAGDSSVAEEAAAAHILITYLGCKACPPGITRNRTEAEDLARRIAHLARQRGANFEELVRKYSEDPAAKATGGYLGIFRHGDMELPFDIAVFNMKVGQVGTVVETDYGFHIIERLPVQRAWAHHILFTWEGAPHAPSGITRTKAQAEALAREVQIQAAAAGADFCELARKYSDDSGNRTLCGDLGIIEPGVLPRPFEVALFRLRPGQVSDVVETEYGYHIIWRQELPKGPEPQEQQGG